MRQLNCQETFGVGSGSVSFSTGDGYAKAGAK